MRTLDDSLALRAAVTATEGARVIVIGAGFIGAEVASTCSTLGCNVTVLEALGIPLQPILGPEIGSYCGSLHGAHGVDLRTGRCSRRGARARAGSGRLEVELDGGEVLAADVVVVGIGVVPETGWLEGSGLTLENGVACDDRLFAGTASWRRATWPAGPGGTTGPKR